MNAEKNALADYQKKLDALKKLEAEYEKEIDSATQRELSQEIDNKEYELDKAKEFVENIQRTIIKFLEPFSQHNISQSLLRIAEQLEKQNKGYEAYPEKFPLDPSKVKTEKNCKNEDKKN